MRLSQAALATSMAESMPTLQSEQLSAEHTLLMQHGTSQLSRRRLLQDLEIADAWSVGVFYALVQVASHDPLHDEAHTGALLLGM